MAADYYQALGLELTRGFWLSLKIIGPSAVGGFLIGLVTGAVRGAGHPRFLARLLDGYVALFRGTALLVQIFIVYYGLPNLAQALNLPPFWKALLSLSPYQASVLVFALCSGAYHSEYIRGAVLSIGRGQFQAARALGFTRFQTFAHIVLPQALRRAWPGCGNEIIYLIKYSSLAFVVSARELTGAAQSVSNTYFRFTETFLVAGLYYLALVTLATWLFQRLEKAWARP
ncbi:MAG: amino acid ABC transporter permease [Candidatus Adiutrix sp.]|jgi:polar amino acid transport system permease protein|nr:amino acid ABC transporter permease [Candidatus Adiutrix sp.]